MPDEARLVAAGVGSAAGTPDRCVLHAGLHVMAGTVADALHGCAELARRAVATLAEHGVGAPDVRTTDLAVRDFFDQAAQRVTARVASYQLQVTIRDLGAVGDVLGALGDVAGDSLQVQAMRLALGDGDAEALADEARRRAVLDARRAAATMAGAAGVRLGAIVAVEAGPTSGGTRPGVRHVATQPAGGRHPAAPVPVEPGETTVTSTVTLTYAITA